ncbi:MAG: hypothetical protein JWP67_1671 [Mucilaginibacter sp.]|nr:hypothetical protein [Mucilaginibacter sp.]
MLQRSYPGKLLKALEEQRVIKTLPHTPGVPNELYQINHSKALEELRVINIISYTKCSKRAIQINYSKALEELRVIETLFHTPRIPNDLYQINHSKALEEPRVYRKFAEYLPGSGGASYCEFAVVFKKAISLSIALPR